MFYLCGEKETRDFAGWWVPIVTGSKLFLSGRFVGQADGVCFWQVCMRQTGQLLDSSHVSDVCALNCWGWGSRFPSQPFQTCLEKLWRAKWRNLTITETSSPLNAFGMNCSWVCESELIGQHHWLTSLMFSGPREINSLHYNFCWKPAEIKKAVIITKQQQKH